MPHTFTSTKAISLAIAWLLALSTATSVNRCARADWPAGDARNIEITLRPSCTTSDDVLLMSHIARVSASDESTRQFIESLDIVDAPRWGESIEVPQKLVEFRLRVAGIDPYRVIIRGTTSEVRRVLASEKPQVDPVAASTRPQPKIKATSHTPAQPVEQLRSGESVMASRTRQVAPPAPKEKDEGPTGQDRTLEDMIVNAAKRGILAQLPWGPEQVSMQLAHSIGRDSQWADPPEGYTCSTQLRTVGTPLGRVNVEVTMKNSGQAPIVVPLAFDVRHFENVVATYRPVARGHAIQKEDLYLQRWDVTGATDYCTKPEQLIGRVANRSMPAAQILREQDMVRTTGEAGSTDRPVTVKRQSRVKMVSRIGDLNITVNGEALQDGRIGESINVQNVDTRYITKGRVISADEVEVLY